MCTEAPVGSFITHANNAKIHQLQEKSCSGVSSVYRLVIKQTVYEPRTICHLTLAAAPPTAAGAETQARVGGGARMPASVKDYRINHKHLLCLESIVSAPVVQVVAHTSYN